MPSLVPRLALLAAVAVAVASARSCRPQRYNTTAQRLPGALNAHIVPHTHDDAGWLKTVDQYLYGLNQTIQIAGVAPILDSVVAALAGDGARRFAYGEVAFFARWWDDASDETRATVRRLVEEGRLEFINGGWVQHDEAASHYEDMVAQTARGHGWLARELGAVPTVAWQIDPFGHSATQASLLTADAGFDALFFGRSDYQDLAGRAAAGALETVWRGDPASRGADADVLAGAFASGNYGPPPGFNWDWGQPDDGLVDSVCSAVNNVAAKVDAFVAAVETLATTTRHCDPAASPSTCDGSRDVMLTMGSDFQYSAARVWYGGLDALIHAVNADGRVHALYSTPGAYAAARAAAAPPLPLKTDDYFPYADCPSCYWTGYFTSRPALKKGVRDANALLAAARALAAVDALAAPSSAAASRPLPAWMDAIDPLADAAGIGMHHDAVTGTARQHVTDDYNKRLASGAASVAPLLTAALADAALGALAPAAGDLALCPASNSSHCGPSVRATADGRPFVVVVHNPLARARSAPVRVPMSMASVTSNATWSVWDGAGAAVPSQIVPLSAGARRVRDSVRAARATDPAAAGDAVLAFVAPALGPHASVAFTIAPVGVGESGAAAESVVIGRWGGGAAPLTAPPPAPSPPSILLAPDPKDRASAALVLDAYTGEPTALATRGGVLTPLRFGAAAYNASDGSPTPDGRPAGSVSGAYIFRPHTRLDEGRPAVEAVAGPVVAEARLAWPAATLDVALWAGAPDAVVTWTAGPLPSDGVGREVVVEYRTDVADAGAPPTLLTDANGRRLLRRVLNERPSWQLNVTEPTAGNYYPVAALAVLKKGGERGAGAGATFAVAVDRGQGAASLAPGVVEVMLHRRLFVDDTRGVVEPLNETACGCRACGCGGLAVAGTHVLVATGGDDNDEAGAVAARGAALAAARPVIVAYGAGRPDAPPPRVFTARPPPVAPLPPNMHLLSLEPAQDGTDRVVVRLAHLFGADECGGGADKNDTLPSASACAPATVDLNALLPGVRFDAAVEVTVGGVRPLASVRRTAWRVEGEGGGGAPLRRRRMEPPLECRGGCAHKRLKVTIGAMEVRTYALTPRRDEGEEGVSTA